MARIYPLTHPIKADIVVPGSKSYTNRALIIASLANGKSILSGCSNSNDSLILVKSLQQLGIDIIRDENKITITGNGGKFKEFHGAINIGDAGTAMRFLTALCCLVPGEITLEGSARMHERPIKGLLDALLQLGANIEYPGEHGFAPLKIKGGILHRGKVKIDASLSSQFISALLMIAPVLDSPLEIISNEEISSAPYVDMTISAMQHFGVFVTKEINRYSIHNSPYTPADYIVEGDATSASYFFALAAITQSIIRVNNISESSLQGDVKFVDLLQQMGCTVIKNENYIEVTGAKELYGISADMKNMQDVAQTLAVVAAFAKGKTILKGLKNLELKETKRLTALQKELTKMGIECSSDGEQLIIQGGNPKGAFINTYKDHRMAMAFAIAGTRIDDLKIESPEVVNKSYPDFWKTLRKIGVRIDIEKSHNIVLIGFMGAGKSTIGKLLAESLQLPLIETDDEIIKRSGLNSVNEIFEKKGETYFRELEKEVLYNLSRQSNCIISCGGGAIVHSENIEALKENGTIIFLSASFETIANRIKEERTRPLFNDIEKARELYTQRQSFYEKYADIVIETDNFSPGEIAESIVKMLTSDNLKTCLVIKDKVSKSLSPAMHNAAYKALGIDSHYIFLPRQIKPEELKNAIQHDLRASSIAAFAVTIPHKESIMKYLDSIDETTEKIGAVNTVINMDSKLKGYNTDWLGAMNTLKKFTSIKNKKIAILGSGGTARAICYGLSKEDCRIIIYARNILTASAIANQFGCKTYSWDKREEAYDAAIIINTTPIGREDDNTPIVGSGLTDKHVVFDVNYKKGNTQLLNLAKQKNATIIDGLEMLLQQGMLQFELYTGLKAPEQAMRGALQI